MIRGLVALVLIGCSDTSEPVDVSTGTDASMQSETSAPSDTNAPSDTVLDVEVVLPETLAASDYCETIVESFCDYYVRCGRMAVASVEACRPVFLETCNARYEPLWQALADAGHVSLSRVGSEQCAAWLADVSCEQQQNDLDWGCALTWRGEVAAGGACGPGLESFVCAAGTTCIIGLDFCGECVPLAARDEPCDLEHRCAPTAECVDGACVDRTKVGEACTTNDAVGCVLGAGCIEGVCRADAIVAVGDACDIDHRCPYKSVCMGTCVETAVLGGECDTSFGCASGWCDEGRCVPLLHEGDACTSSGACTSGRCDPDTRRCTPIAHMCSP